MADVEIIFPSKKVGVKPFQLVNLLVTVITALVTGALMVYKVRTQGLGALNQCAWVLLGAFNGSTFKGGF